MSELIQRNKTQSTAKWKLLAGVSALALIANASSSTAKAEDADRPTVWIELGGQLEHGDGGEQRFAPPFASLFEPSEFSSPVNIQRPPRYSIGTEAKFTVVPDDSDWKFSASLRYGRSNRSHRSHQELNLETATKYAAIPAFGIYYTGTITAEAKRFSDATFESRESHAVLDFQAGRDLGLGLFGNHSTSTLSFGVRFAQFQSRNSTTIGGDPDFVFENIYLTQIFGIPGTFRLPLQHWHLFASRAEIARSFRGVGPSLSWDNSVPVLGKPDGLNVAFDWGLNGALLFGRQKAKGHHETSADYRPTIPVTSGNVTALVPVYRHSYDVDRSRSVVIPNIGGFAGLSFNYANAKIKLGYRVDAFLDAMDGGIDTRKTYDRDFYGPFATISIGLGG